MSIVYTVKVQNKLHNVECDPSESVATLVKKVEQICNKKLEHIKLAGAALDEEDIIDEVVYDPKDILTAVFPEERTLVGSVRTSKGGTSAEDIVEQLKAGELSDEIMDLIQEGKLSKDDIMRAIDHAGIPLNEAEVQRILSSSTREAKSSNRAKILDKKKRGGELSKDDIIALIRGSGTELSSDDLKKMRELPLDSLLKLCSL